VHQVLKKNDGKFTLPPLSEYIDMGQGKFYNKTL